MTADITAVGVDAPFGWPMAFRKAVVEWTSEEWNGILRDEMTYRLTDKKVIDLTGVRPLRVAADRIAIPAMRAMAFLRRHNVTDLSGATENRFFEVYPAASLRVWGLLPFGSYKQNTPDALENRKQILCGLKQRFNLVGDGPSLDADYLLDALIAALTAHSAKKGVTHQPVDAEWEAARVEGWIHVPR